MEFKLEGNKIILRPMSKEDAEKLHDYSKEPKLNEYSGPYKSSKSLEDAKAYILRCNECIKESKSYHFGIYEKKNMNFVGVIGFVNVDAESKKGEIGFWVAKDYWNKGFMSEAVEMITNFVFNELKFHRVYASFHELNKAVEKILQKAGYEKEGELKGALFTKGKYYNDIIYGKINKTTD